jgi:hypothetical protein
VKEGIFFAGQQFSHAEEATTKPVCADSYNTGVDERIATEETGHATIASFKR